MNINDLKRIVNEKGVLDRRELLSLLNIVSVEPTTIGIPDVIKDTVPYQLIYSDGTSLKSNVAFTAFSNGTLALGYSNPVISNYILNINGNINLQNDIHYQEERVLHTKERTSLFLGTLSGNKTYSGTGLYSLGHRSLEKVTTGSNNFGGGGYSLFNLTTGVGNVAIGNTSGYTLTTGSYNTFLGYASGADTTPVTVSSSIGIGYYSLPTANNQVVIGGHRPDGVTGGEGRVTDMYLGAGVDAPVALLSGFSAFTIQPTTTVGANQKGIDLRIAQGRGSGAANTTKLIFAVSTPTTSGVTQQVLTDVAYFNALGHLLPNITTTYNLGSGALRWNNIFGGNIIGNTISNVTTVDPSAVAQFDTTTQGFLPPRMLGTAAEAINTPAEGLLVYALDGSGSTITSKGWWGFNGANWEKLN